ncbi:MAG: hypothetical protein A2289_07070 [Deltaproteobacteria bacterium RIFOXYA12_FULL_58_15]|nr:MAG: hypothetical protein A2289_07070 [Deltaproteobacteria bacterium RIFOXYA12_FULL_58_15]OGR08144.1 MAG: hypothetical protein A2341_05615 [Deltaproteobacteria bacterium RIFOXYB12_FULL_58_9]
MNAIRLGCIVALFAVVTACGGTKLYVRPGAVAPQPATDKFVIMPVKINGLSGDTLAQQAALFGGLVSAFGESAVPLQPIQPALEAAGFGNLGEQIAYGMHHMVSFHDSYDFNEDAGFHGGNSEYQMILEATGKLIELVATELKLDFKPKYIVVAAIDSVSSSIPKTAKYRVVSGIYNLEESKLDEVIWFESSTADDAAAILAEMGTLGGKLKGLLIVQSES